MTSKQPPRETWYCWKEYATAAATDELPADTMPRLLTPWSDPYEHEYMMDGLFVSPEEARAAKRELAPDEDWVLCKLVLEPVEVPPVEPAGTKRHLLMTTCSQDADGIRWDCDLALLYVDEPFLAQLSHRVALLREAHAQDSAVHELSFWAPSQPAFYHQAAADLMQLSPEEEDLLDRGAFVVLHRVDRPLAIDAQHEQSVTLCRMILCLTPTTTPDESPLIVVAWSAFPGSSDTSVLTAEVPVEVFGI